MMGGDIHVKPGEQIVATIQYTISRELLKRRAELAKQTHELLAGYLNDDAGEVEKPLGGPCYFDLVGEIEAVEDEIRQQLDVKLKGITVQPAVLRKETKS